MANIYENDILNRFPGHTLTFTTNNSIITWSLKDGGSNLIQSYSGQNDDVILRKLRGNLGFADSVLLLSTTAQRDALSSVEDGQEIFNTTLGEQQSFDGTVWKSGGGGDFLGSFDANDALFPSSDPAVANSRNAHPVLAYDDTVTEQVIFSGVISKDYAGGNLSVNIDWVAETATSGDVTFGVSFERIAAGGTDIDSDSFAAERTSTDTTNGTSGIVTRTTITFTKAQADGIVAGDAFRLKVRRGNLSGDTMTDDAQVLQISLGQ